MKVTDLQEKEVIHCRTKQEAVRICGMMHEAGLRWCNENFYNEVISWDTFGAETCYRPHGGQFGDLKLYKDRYTIHPSELFQDEAQPSDEITEDALLVRRFYRHDWTHDGENFFEWKLMTPTDYRIEVNESFTVEIVTLGVATKLPAVKTITDIDHLIRLLQ